MTFDIKMLHMTGISWCNSKRKKSIYGQNSILNDLLWIVVTGMRGRMIHVFFMVKDLILLCQLC